MVDSYVAMMMPVVTTNQIARRLLDFNECSALDWNQRFTRNVSVIIANDEIELFIIIFPRVGIKKSNS